MLCLSCWNFLLMPNKTIFYWGCRNSCNYLLIRGIFRMKMLHSHQFLFVWGCTIRWIFSNAYTGGFFLKTLARFISFQWLIGVCIVDFLINFRPFIAYKRLCGLLGKTILTFLFHFFFIGLLYSCHKRSF